MRRLGWLYVRWLCAVAVGLVLVAGCASAKKSAGPTTTTGSVSTSSTVASSTVPSFSGSASSSYCKLATQFSQAISPNLSGADSKQLFQEFDDQAGPFVSASPSDIRPDVETVVGAIKQLETVFRAVNYDATKLTATDLAPVASASFSTATARINAYDVQVCGITPPST